MRLSLVPGRAGVRDLAIGASVRHQGKRDRRRLGNVLDNEIRTCKRRDSRLSIERITKSHRIGKLEHDRAVEVERWHRCWRDFCHRGKR